MAVPTGQAHKTLILSLVGLALLLAWQALHLGSYVREETRPPAWDQAIHMEIALDYREALQEGRWEDVLHLAPKPGMPPFPPLYHLLLMRSYDSPDPARAALWVNWLYMAVLCLALFGVIWEFRPDHAALAGVVCFACAPAVQDMLTTQLIDLPVTALATAAVWSLLRSDDFKVWWASLLFGALFALGMMHKWSFFSYLLPAYLIGFRALSFRSSRWQALAAAAVALAGFGPWYFSHLPLLVPRLLQASSDFAIPFWRGGAIFTYLMASGTGLGPPFWILAWIGLLVPQYRRNWDKSWVIPTWVAASYIFWTLVPNRQLRFLLPGLPALSVAFVSAWPPSALWSAAAFQLFACLNYAAGWISPLTIPMPFHPIQVFPSSPPRREDWKLAEILEEAQRRHAPDSPVGNLTLVANAPHFNPPTMTWVAKTLKLPNVRLRGVNSRLCEFSEFLLLKTGTLGPPGVISGLPEAVGTVLKKGGWFERAYAEARRWPLPDGSQAVLYQRRKLAAPPFRSRRLSFQFYESGPFTATDFKVALGPWDAAQGTFVRATASSDAVALRSLRVNNIALEMEGLALVPVDPAPSKEWEEVRFLKMRRLKVRSASVEAGDLKAFLEARVRNLRVDRLELDRTLRLSGRLGPLAVSVEASLELSDSPRRLLVRLRDARLGVTPLPTAVLNRVKELTVPLDPSPETPFAIDLPGLTLAKGRLTIP